MKSSVERKIRLLWAGIMLLGLLSGCGAQAENQNDAGVSGQMKASPDLTDGLSKYKGYQTAAPAPTTAPEEEIRQFLVTNTAHYIDENGDLVFVGRIENLTSYPLDYVIATVSLLDESGEVVLSGSDYTLLDVTFPDEANAFRVKLGKDVPDWLGYEVGAVGDSYLGDYLNPELDLAIAVAGSSESGGFEIAGEVINRGQEVAQDVYVLVLLYDKQRNLLDADAVATDLKVIPVRGASAFEYLWEQGEGVQVGRYEIILQGYR